MSFLSSQSGATGVGRYLLISFSSLNSYLPSPSHSSDFPYSFFPLPLLPLPFCLFVQFLELQKFLILFFVFYLLPTWHSFLYRCGVVWPSFFFVFCFFFLKSAMFNWHAFQIGIAVSLIKIFPFLKKKRKRREKPSSLSGSTKWVATDYLREQALDSYTPAVPPCTTPKHTWNWPRVWCLVRRFILPSLLCLDHKPAALSGLFEWPTKYISIPEIKLGTHCMQSVLNTTHKMYRSCKKISFFFFL